jgi:hypothetical protein
MPGSGQIIKDRDLTRENTTLEDEPSSVIPLGDVCIFVQISLECRRFRYRLVDERCIMVRNYNDRQFDITTRLKVIIKSSH